MKRSLLIMFLKNLQSILENYSSAKDAAKKEQLIHIMKEKVDALIALLITVKH